MEKLTELYASDKHISNLAGLEHTKNLEQLDLSINKISDISSLKDLKKLKTLNLNNNKIENIAVLSELEQIQELYLSNNNICSILPLAVLAKLTNLNISNNCIKNIFPLIGLKRLAELDASENNIANISPLSYLFVSSLISLKCSNQHLNASNFKKVELVGFRGKSLQKINLKNTKICNNSYLLEFYDEFHSDADKWAHKFGCFSGIIEIENS